MTEENNTCYVSEPEKLEMPEKYHKIKIVGIILAILLVAGFIWLGSNLSYKNGLKQGQIIGYEIRNAQQLEELNNYSATLVYYFDAGTNASYGLKLVPVGNWSRLG